ncbi:MAG: RidA family protein [Chthoniobacterales bacterium]
MSKQTLSQIPGGPPVIGPYSPVVIAEGRFAYVSGQIPFDPEAGKIIRGSITEQAEIVLSNLKRAVEATGANLADVVSCRVYPQPLTPETFAEMNAVYARVFGENKPARTTLGAGLLGFDVEIEAVVVLPQS